MTFVSRIVSPRSPEARPCQRSCGAVPCLPQACVLPAVRANGAIRLVRPHKASNASASVYLVLLLNRGMLLNTHAAESTRDTETLTRYPSAAKSRINRSLDTLSRFPFKMDVTLVREEHPLRATSEWVSPPSATICLSRFSSACWTCHSCASTPLSPNVRAKVSGVLAVIVLVFILHLPESLPRQLDFRWRCLLSLFHECMKYENAFRTGQEIEHSKLAVFAT
jgi:hypothetical protein